MYIYIVNNFSLQKLKIQHVNTIIRFLIFLISNKVKHWTVYLFHIDYQYNECNNNVIKVKTTFVYY